MPFKFSETMSWRVAGILGRHRKKVITLFLLDININLSPVYEMITLTSLGM
jgi:hypothetical protein